MRKPRQPDQPDQPDQTDQSYNSQLARNLTRRDRGDEVESDKMIRECTIEPADSVDAWPSAQQQRGHRETQIYTLTILSDQKRQVILKSDFQADLDSLQPGDLVEFYYCGDPFYNTRTPDGVDPASGSIHVKGLPPGWFYHLSELEGVGLVVRTNRMAGSVVVLTKFEEGGSLHWLSTSYYYLKIKSKYRRSTGVTAGADSGDAIGTSGPSMREQ